MAKVIEAQTNTDICNLALVQDGANLIMTLADSNTSAEAQLCRQLLPVVLSICKARWEWTGLTKFKGLGNEVNAPDKADWAFVFNLPEDCVAVIAQIAQGNHRKKFPYAVKGQQLYTNDLSNDAGDSAYIDYISVGDAEKLSPGFIEYASLKLAIMMAPKLMGISEESALHIQNMQRELRLRVLPEAIGRNQAEGDDAGGNHEGESLWLRGRSTGASGLNACDCCGGFPCRC